MISKLIRWLSLVNPWVWIVLTCVGTGVIAFMLVWAMQSMGWVGYQP